MKAQEHKRIDREFELFTLRHFEKPRKCKNLEQVRFYVQELVEKIEDFKHRFDYVPEAAYQLLAQYNTIQNSMVFEEFKKTY
ncbi:hypothetical protein E1176_04695 [Fulvivirga sp. RKSG066]|uniref:hypothetical protein n=1 Tax=Fulvivirga aurantia TaxID=2529383 RepID=UPI0012BB500E|nr:hypothetical protein [Fulvivirga aurantia]MTI20312.1 hypothetical protein [Fulvivirga aurantia]